MRCALIEKATGLVVNVVMADPADLPGNGFVLKATETANIGDMWNSGTNDFNVPAAPPVAPRTGALGYDWVSALADTEAAVAKQRDLLRLAARGADMIPRSNPVLARIALAAAIDVPAWFARIS